LEGDNVAVGLGVRLVVLVAVGLGVNVFVGPNVLVGVRLFRFDNTSSGTSTSKYSITLVAVGVGVFVPGTISTLIGSASRARERLSPPAIKLGFLVATNISITSPVSFSPITRSCLKWGYRTK